MIALIWKKKASEKDELTLKETCVSEDANLTGKSSSNVPSDLCNFLSQEDTKFKVVSLVNSPYSTYKTPKSSFHHVINILNVSRKKKIVDCQGRGSEKCEILSTYREWLNKGQLETRIPEELEKACRNMEKEKREQKPIRQHSRNEVALGFKKVKK